MSLSQEVINTWFGESRLILDFESLHDSENKKDKEEIFLTSENDPFNPQWRSQSMDCLETLLNLLWKHKGQLVGGFLRDFFYIYQSGVLSRITLLSVCLVSDQLVALILQYFQSSYPLTFKDLDVYFTDSEQAYAFVSEVYQKKMTVENFEIIGNENDEEQEHVKRTDKKIHGIAASSYSARNRLRRLVDSMNLQDKKEPNEEEHDQEHFADDENVEQLNYATLMKKRKYSLDELGQMLTHTKNALQQEEQKKKKQRREREWEQEKVLAYLDPDFSPFIEYHLNVGIPTSKESWIPVDVLVARFLPVMNYTVNLLSLSYNAQNEEWKTQAHKPYSYYYGKQYDHFKKKGETKKVQHCRVEECLWQCFSRETFQLPELQQYWLPFYKKAHHSQSHANTSINHIAEKAYQKHTNMVARNWIITNM